MSTDAGTGFDPWQELRERLRSAREQARQLVEDALLLREAAGALRTRGLRTRCAWCGRYQAADRWVEPRRLLPPPWGAFGETHSICPDCLDALRDEGRSA